MRLSDLEDLDEEEAEIKADAPPKHHHHEGPVIGGTLAGSEKSHSGLTSSGHFHAFPCAKSDSASAGDFLHHKGATIVTSLGMAGQPYEAPEKPRIWSLAHTAGANVIVDPAGGLAQRTDSPDCLVVRGRLPGAGGQCSEGRPLGNLARAQPVHDKALEELVAQPAKLFRNSTFNLQSISLNCASYPMLGETCQYSAGAEGSRSLETFPILPYPEVAHPLFKGRSRAFEAEG